MIYVANYISSNSNRKKTFFICRWYLFYVHTDNQLFLIRLFNRLHQYRLQVCVCNSIIKMYAYQCACKGNSEPNFNPNTITFNLKIETNPENLFRSHVIKKQFHDVNELVRARRVAANDILEIFHSLRLDISYRTLHTHVTGGERNNRSFKANLKLIGLYYFFMIIHLNYNAIIITQTSNLVRTMFSWNNLHHVHSLWKYWKSK